MALCKKCPAWGAEETVLGAPYPDLDLCPEHLLDWLDEQLPKKREDVVRDVLLRHLLTENKELTRALDHHTTNGGHDK